MFGYITIAGEALSVDRQARYRSFYCGLCHTLGRRFGTVGRMTLSNDATFLYLLLSSLYEPEEESGFLRCVPHPIKPHGYVYNSLAAYCCDMNIALAYHKCLDDWQDDGSLIGRAEAQLLKTGYEGLCERYPEKCRLIEETLHTMGAMEKSGNATLDDMANASAKMLGAIYRYQEDLWSDSLQRIGQGLGRFIYLMDAFEDLGKDMRKNRFNPLKAIHEQEDYQAFVKESLTLLIAECTDAFETLPLVQDMDILRNILYAGCWTRYHQLTRPKKSNVPAQRNERAHKEDGA